MTDNTRLEKLTKVLAVEMTASTGELWRAAIDADSWVTQIYSPTAYISLKLEEWRQPHKLTAWASTPKGIAHLSDDGQMSCNPERQPEAIAADITRRLVAHARAYLVKCKASQDEHDKAERKKQLIKNLIGRYLTNNGRDVFYSDKVHNVEVRGEYIEMRLSISPVDAIRVCKLLKG